MLFYKKALAESNPYRRKRRVEKQIRTEEKEVEEQIRARISQII